MGLSPITTKRREFLIKECQICKEKLGPDSYAKTKSIFYADGALPICNNCVRDWLVEHDWDWGAVDKLCQLADIPFVPREWEKMREYNGDDVFPQYAELFLGQEYQNLGWGDYYKEYKSLREANLLEGELPKIDEHKRQLQRERWGHNYDDEGLDYLDSLYQGLISTQNVNGALQLDQAIKICKISYEIDQRIAEGADFDKLLSSYDKLVKTAEFTPKNVKNINDFDTTGELVRWMEKKGWRNKFYDNVSRDIVDETIQNFQNFNQRLYTNENGIGEEITKRIEALQSAKELESYYGTDKAYNLESYDNEGYESLFHEEEEFDPGAKWVPSDGEVENGNGE